jgi:hypothetical protein
MFLTRNRRLLLESFFTSSQASRRIDCNIDDMYDSFSLLLLLLASLVSLLFSLTVLAVEVDDEAVVVVVVIVVVFVVVVEDDGNANDTCACLHPKKSRN